MRGSRLILHFLGKLELIAQTALTFSFVTFMKFSKMIDRRVIVIDLYIIALRGRNLANTATKVKNIELLIRNEQPSVRQRCTSGN